VIREI